MLSLSDLDTSKFSDEARSALDVVRRTELGEETLEAVLAELDIDVAEHQRRMHLLQVEWRAQGGDTELPPLTAEERAALRDSIAEVGQIYPILRAPEHDGWIVDGEHRQSICLELGLEPVYKDVFGSAEELQSLAFVVNLARRQLTAEARRGIITSELLRDPEQSDRAIAKHVGVGHPTVARVRRDLTQMGQLERRSSSTGLDGYTRPIVAKPAPPKPEIEVPEGVIDVTLRIASAIAEQLDGGGWLDCKAVRLARIGSGIYELQVKT